MKNKENLRFYVIIPAHNEEAYIAKTLDSLLLQNPLPKKIIVVDDHSTDRTAAIVQEFSKNFDFVKLIQIESSDRHLPGSKVVHAFNEGLKQLDQNFDILCKFDADLIFPKNYFKELNRAFQENPQLGMAGGFCYIEKNNQWELENLTDKFHIRGALKAYRKACFEAIGGLKPAMGWDTLDELLAQYHGWEINTLSQLKVKHLRPTGATYKHKDPLIFGEALYRMRYGFFISLLTSAKMAWLKKDRKVFFNYMKGYFSAKRNKSGFLISSEEGKWIRNYRWRNMRKKLFKI